MSGKARQTPPEAADRRTLPIGKRAKVLLAVVEGLSDRQAAKRVGCDRETIGALRRDPSFAAEVAAEMAIVRERRQRVIERGALVGMRRLMKDAREADDDRGTRAAIELAKLGLAVKQEVTGKDGGPQEHKLGVTIAADEVMTRLRDRRKESKT